MQRGSEPGAGLGHEGGCKEGSWSSDCGSAGGGVTHPGLGAVPPDPGRGSGSRVALTMVLWPTQDEARC